MNDIFSTDLVRKKLYIYIQTDNLDVDSLLHHIYYKNEMVKFQSSRNQTEEIKC